MKLFFANRLRSRPRTQGIALVITLILLAIITFMAIAFLVISRGDRSSVGSMTDKSLASLAADTALERAKTELIASMLAYGNRHLYGLSVSTNFINPIGFQPGNSSITNVSFAYPNGAPVAGNDQLQNLTNLYLNPRVPVYIRTPAGFEDFRFYLDLNRNGMNEPSGWLAETNGLGLPIRDANNNLVVTYRQGDPEFIGGLEFADRPHSATNRFLFRYAYLVAPSGKTLDVNRIHNYAKQLAPASMNTGDGFMRNQGVGTFEINLAAFLVDLNTNFWPFPVATSFGTPYRYDYTDLRLPNTGAAFDDAFGFLRFRYAGNPQANLASAATLFGLPGVNAFRSDYFDGYSGGPLMLGTSWLRPGAPDPDGGRRVTTPWPGAPAPNSYFSPQDFFDPAKTSPQFVTRLDAASTNLSTYDRYTYYRLLSQLGTDSAPESSDKVHLNYININGFFATNFISWDSPLITARLLRPGSEVFFTNAVDKLLRTHGYTKFLTEGIPVFTNSPNGPVFCYTPAVHRLLQVAANIYDSLTNHVYANANTYPFLPTVFRPLFRNDNGEIYIQDFREVTDTNFLNLGTLRDLADTNVAVNVQPNDLIFGVPLIIGAKKGHPNFNEVSMQTLFQVTRKMEVTRPSVTAKPNATNLMYVIGVSNLLGVEAWNSYAAAYKRPVTILVTNYLTMELTNNYGFRRGPFIRTLSRATNIVTWPGYAGGAGTRNDPSVFVPLRADYQFMPDVQYVFPNLVTSNLNAGFQRGIGFPLPRWGLGITNRLHYMMIDQATQRIVDYVQLSGMNSHLDLTDLISTTGTGFNGLWNTNRAGGNPNDISAPFAGAIYQVSISLGNENAPATEWNNYGANQFSGVTKLQEIDKFRAFFGLTPNTFPGTINTNLQAQVPFSPTRRVSQYLTWQANDPLVHYTAGDLFYVAGGNGIEFPSPSAQVQTLKNLGSVNVKYNPWGGNPSKGAEADTENAFRIALKDPLVTRSDDWDFPTNKFPNVGWLGRVHRGTPWQTVYLKASNVVSTTKELENWKRWTGNTDNRDATVTAPINDRKLLEVFTAGITPDATRGQLDINQDGLAAWSAILSGVVALQGDTNAISAEQRGTNFAQVVIEPAGTVSNAAVWRIVNAINESRRTNYSGTFKVLGDVLSAPELTEASPFLSAGPATQNLLQWGVSDAVYERIPQQILGLLKIENTPRFVVYSYGQALKPADRSIVVSGQPQYLGLCTNYQITAEVATRAVVRVEGAPQNPRVVVESFNVLPPD